MTTWILLFLFLPLIMGVMIYALDRVWFNRLIFVMQGLLSLFFMVLVKLSPYRLVIGGWPNTVGVECVVDPISLLFMGMTLIGFWFIFLYDWPVRQNDHKYLFLICTLQSVMLSLFIAYDLFTFFILIELMTIIASILITYKKDSHSVKAGIYYLLINSMGMVLYIIGVMMLYSLTGSLNIHVVVAQLPLILSSQLFKLAMAFIITSIAVKSAFFPLFHWLPVAHSAAPGSISAILSGLIVKSGIFLFFRLNEIIHGAALNNLMLVIGLLTAFAGVLLASLQFDIKRMLSYHTVSQIGLMVTGLSIPGVLTNMGGMLHIFNHFLFKSLLFLCAGLIITQTGERNLKRLRGMFRSNPLLSLSMIVAILGIVGFPFFNGQLSKMLIKSGYDPWVNYMLYLVNVGTLVSFMKLFNVFTGPPMKTIVETRNRQYAVYVMAGLTLLAFPLELVYLRTNVVSAYAYVMEKWITNSLEFAVQGALAWLIFAYVLAPGLKRNNLFMKRIKGMGLVYFGESAALILTFMGLLHVFILNV